MTCIVVTRKLQLVLLLVVKGNLYSFTVKLSGKYACFIIIFIIHINIVYFEAEISFACIYSVKLYLYGDIILFVRPYHIAYGHGDACDRLGVSCYLSLIYSDLIHNICQVFIGGISVSDNIIRIIGNDEIV